MVSVCIWLCDGVCVVLCVHWCVCVCCVSLSSRELVCVCVSGVHIGGGAYLCVCKTFAGLSRTLYMAGLMNQSTSEHNTGNSLVLPDTRSVSVVEKNRRCSDRENCVYSGPFSRALKIINRRLSDASAHFPRFRNLAKQSLCERENPEIAENAKMRNSEKRQKAPKAEKRRSSGFSRFSRF